MSIVVTSKTTTTFTVFIYIYILHSLETKSTKKSTNQPVQSFISIYTLFLKQRSTSKIKPNRSLQSSTFFWKPAVSLPKKLTFQLLF